MTFFKPATQSFRTQLAKVCRVFFIICTICSFKSRSSFSPLKKYTELSVRSHACQVQCGTTESACVVCPSALLNLIPACLFICSKSAHSHMTYAGLRIGCRLCQLCISLTVSDLSFLRYLSISRSC